MKILIEGSEQEIADLLKGVVGTTEVIVSRVKDGEPVEADRETTATTGGVEDEKQG